jgi:hypothetical protein
MQRYAIAISCKWRSCGERIGVRVDFREMYLELLG